MDMPKNIRRQEAHQNILDDIVMGISDGAVEEPVDMTDASNTDSEQLPMGTLGETDPNKAYPEGVLDDIIMGGIDDTLENSIAMADAPSVTANANQEQVASVNPMTASPGMFGENTTPAASDIV